MDYLFEIAMDYQQMKEWRQHNDKLQDHYKAYLSANNQEEKDSAIANIQKELFWGPFMCICCDKKIPLIHITERGLDPITIQCIEYIDIIAKSEYITNCII